MPSSPTVWRQRLVLAAMVWAVGFFLHFFWEMVQVPFFTGMEERPHRAVVWLCGRAAAGDANIALGAYLVTATLAKCWFWGSRVWETGPLAIYLGCGLAVTIVFENWATGTASRWQYSELMPVLPVIDTGALPFIQWLVLPVLILLTVRWMFLGWRASQDLRSR